MIMAKSFQKKGSKHCRKRRNCSLQAISSFPTVFSKDLYSRHVKTRACLRISMTLLFNPFPNKPMFLRVYHTSLLKTLWEKKILLVTSNFSFSHSVLYPFGELCYIFTKSEIVVCKCFQFGRVENLSFGKWLILPLPKRVPILSRFKMFSVHRMSLAMQSITYRVRFHHL